MRNDHLDDRLDVNGLLARVSQEALMIVSGEDKSGRRDFRCLWANAALEVLLGAAPGTLIGRSFLDVLPDGGQLYDLLVRAESTGSELVGEADVEPRVAPVTRIGYRIVPEGGVLGVSLSDQSPLREAEARDRWLQHLVTGGAKVSAVAAGILHPVLRGDEVVDLEFEYLNELGGQLLGVDPNLAVGRLVSSFSTNDEQARSFAEIIGCIWRSGTPRVTEIPLSSTLLQASYIRCHVIPMDSKIVIHADDVSSKRATQRALRASEHRYRSLFETANEGIALSDIDGRILVANDAFASMLGSTPLTLLGRSILSILAETERERTVDDARAAMAGEFTTQRRQVRLKRLDGSEFWAFVASTLSRDFNGVVDGFLIMVLDVDEQFQSSIALAASESRYRAIVEHADMLLALTDRFGKLIFVNERLLTILGATSEDVLGQPANKFHITSNQPTAIDDYRALRSGVARYAHNRITLVALDGRHVPAVGSAVAIRNSEGIFDGMVIVGTDITELVEQENARRNLAAALAVAEQREQERLALDLHDGPVQTLTALSLRLGTARRSGSINNELVATTEEQISNCIRELRMLLFQLTPPNLVSETLGACLADHARHVLGPTVSVAIDDRTTRQLDDQIIDSMFRIGQEALMNVAKHAGASVVQMSLYNTPRHVVLEIGDNGAGASPEAFSKRSSGHLGISGMLERARLLGGTCEIESTIGEGTTVFIRLPIDLSNSSSTGS